MTRRTWKRCWTGAERHGTPGLVIDQPGSIAQLALAVAAKRGTPVAYVPGLVMRRAADLYSGGAKTDRRDAYVLADTGRTRRKQVHWLDAGSDELLASLRVLNGFDIDLATDATWLASRLRDALTSISPALERAVGERLHQAGVRDLLVKYPTLTALRAASQSRIERVIKARSPRIAAKASAAVAAALAAEIEEAFLAHPFGELLASMPGIGPRTGARILAEIGDGSAFRDGSKLAAYAGWHRSPASPAPAWQASPAAAAATTGSKTPCSSPPSPPYATPRPRRSTT
jgi:transposase